MNSGCRMPAERERRWITVKTDEERAVADTRCFLLERFSKRQTREEQLVDLQDDFVGEAIILNSTDGLRTFVEQSGISGSARSARATVGVTAGTSWRAVKAKLREINTQLAEVKRKREAEKTKKLKDMHDAILQQLCSAPDSSPEK